MAEPTKSVLSREQIRQALAVLREEQQKHPISSAQRRHFSWYRISVWFFFALLAAGIALIPLLSGSNEKFPWYLLIFAFLLGGSFISMVLLFLWNMKLIWQTWREFRLAVSTKLWPLAARARTGRRWPRRIMIGFAVLLLASFLAGMLTQPYVGVPLTLALLSFFFLRFARKRLDVLRNADQLVAFFTKTHNIEDPAGPDQITIPTDVFNDLGNIEDVHIQRRRATAMDEFRFSGHGYAVLKSRDMIGDIARLENAIQLRVEARLAELTSEFPAPDILREADGSWRVPVTGTPYEIVCRHDEAAGRIECLSLQQGDGKSSTRRTEEAPIG